MQRKGRTIIFNSKPVLLSSAAIVGTKEGEGPLNKYFDKVNQTDKMQKKSWEQEESAMIYEAAELAMKKSNKTSNEVDIVFAGDLLNQSIGSTFGLKDFGIPIYEQFGACSSMAQTLSLCAVFVAAKAANHTMAVSSSHYCTAERQFRFPLEYGGQKSCFSQWTVTGCGAFIVGANGEGPKVNAVTTGKIVDFGITDANNMGAAMAPSAADTISQFLTDTNTKPDDYDYIITGDLASEGSKLLITLLQSSNIDISKNHVDCGNIIYSSDQITCAGASGCGCSASVMASFFMQKLISKELKSVLFCGTGALLSPTAIQQGDSIPSITHIVHIIA